MKNHWTDQKVMHDFITELSEKFAPIVGIDAKLIFEFLEKDVVENPLTDDELREFRTHKDEWVVMAVQMMLDEHKNIKEQFKAALDDGLSKAS